MVQLRLRLNQDVDNDKDKIKILNNKYYYADVAAKKVMGVGITL